VTEIDPIDTDSSVRRFNQRPIQIVSAVVLVAIAVGGSIWAFSAPSASAGSPNDMADMPGMSGMSGMSDMPGMSSGGSDSTAANMEGMAGSGTTDPNWKYTGAPLPQSEVDLLNKVSGLQDQGHAMQTPDCSQAPTSVQTLGAMQYVQATSAAVAKYQNLAAATADGYFPITSTAYPVVHYINPKYMQDKYMLDPEHIDSLVYATTPNGPVLVAAMYLLPRSSEAGPMPYGCLVQWHAHNNLCTSTTTHQISGLAPCPEGTVADAPTPSMTHVWQVPLPGGPLAMDPSDLEVVEGAIMAQQQGLAPTQN
jgi:hypothetical protein